MGRRVVNLFCVVLQVWTGTLAGSGVAWLFVVFLCERDRLCLRCISCSLCFFEILSSVTLWNRAQSSHFHWCFWPRPSLQNLHVYFLVIKMRGTPGCFSSFPLDITSFLTSCNGQLRWCGFLWVLVVALQYCVPCVMWDFGVLESSKGDVSLKLLFF
eukprot:RCo003572